MAITITINEDWRIGIIIAETINSFSTDFFQMRYISFEISDEIYLIWDFLHLRVFFSDEIYLICYDKRFFALKYVLFNT